MPNLVAKDLFKTCSENISKGLAWENHFFGLKILKYHSFWVKTRADCDAPCFDQLKATHLRASPKQQALLDVLLQLIKTWPLTIGPCQNI